MNPGQEAWMAVFDSMPKEVQTTCVLTWLQRLSRSEQVTLLDSLARPQEADRTRRADAWLRTNGLPARGEIVLFDLDGGFLARGQPEDIWREWDKDGRHFYVKGGAIHV